MDEGEVLDILKSRVNYSIVENKVRHDIHTNKQCFTCRKVISPISFQTWSLSLSFEEKISELGVAPLRAIHVSASSSSVSS